jgi:hypothetical protein
MLLLPATQLTVRDLHVAHLTQPRKIAGPGRKCLVCCGCTGQQQLQLRASSNAADAELLRIKLTVHVQLQFADILLAVGAPTFDLQTAFTEQTTVTKFKLSLPLQCIDSLLLPAQITTRELQLQLAAVQPQRVAGQCLHADRGIQIAGTGSIQLTDGGDVQIQLHAVLISLQTEAGVARLQFQSITDQTLIGIVQRARAADRLTAQFSTQRIDGETGPGRAEILRRTGAELALCRQLTTVGRPEQARIDVCSTELKPGLQLFGPACGAFEVQLPVQSLHLQLLQLHALWLQQRTHLQLHRWHTCASQISSQLQL